ncbi:YibE/F family protein, partial [Priestia megaterium]|uniref:YibE/F family protein n=1 Tax=Priestia megaterium TaxID=1404 RepID=UPI0022A67BF3
MEFGKIGICRIIMGVIGGMIDIWVCIWCCMNELFVDDPWVSKKNVLNSGLKMGRDILGRTRNRVYFGFVGGYL